MQIYLRRRVQESAPMEHVPIRTVVQEEQNVFFNFPDLKDDRGLGETFGDNTTIRIYLDALYGKLKWRQSYPGNSIHNNGKVFFVPIIIRPLKHTILNTEIFCSTQ